MLVVTLLLNDVNKRRFSHGMIIKLQVERSERVQIFSEKQMKNVSN